MGGWGTEGGIFKLFFRKCIFTILFLYQIINLTLILLRNFLKKKKLFKILMTFTAVFISYGTLGNFFTECNSATRQLGNSGYQKICDVHSMFIKKTHSLRVMPKTILN